MLRAVEGTLTPLDAYDENDEVVTQFVEPVPEEPKWLVQVTPFDRRSMSRAQMLDELREGRLIRSDTLVWRRGMRNWVSVARVGELGALDALPPDSMPPDSMSPDSMPPNSFPPDSMPPDTRPPTRRPLRAEPAAPARTAGLEWRRAPSEVAVVLASSATSLLIVGVTLALLAWAGAFEAARPFSDRAGPTSREPSAPLAPHVAAPVAAPSASR
jgi:hypothetical protein